MLPVDPARYALFCSVTAAFALMPGPANLFMIATGARAGRQGVAMAVAGLNTASLVWIAAAALGLGALAAAYPNAFRFVAMAGALYVAWLGAKALWSAFAGEGTHLEASKGAKPHHAFHGGFAVQISNPKAIIYFSAILPPFVDPSRPPAMQFVWLCATTVLADIIVMSGYGLAGGALAALLERSGPRRIFAACVGVLLIGVAAFILVRR